MSGPFYQQGVYVCEVVDQGFSKTSTGNRQFILRVKVLGKPDPSNPENYIQEQHQYERNIYRVMTDKTIEYFTQDLEVLGFTGTSFSQLDPANSNAQLFAGNVVDCYCKIGKSQDGSPREEWSIARGGSGGLKIDKPLEKSDFRELDMLFGKSLKGKVSPAPVVRPITQRTDDDVAF